MYYEEPRIPALPGEENVTDGSVDDYGTDWENVDNGALEEEMAKCAATPCDVKTTCPGQRSGAGGRATVRNCNRSM